MLPRHKTLLQLITEKEFSNQNSLVNAMKRKGFDVTQASISRDFRELNIAKIAGVYKTANYSAGTLESPIKSVITAVESAGENMLVVKTTSGAAAAAAEAIDIEEIPGVIGTVAGDNTIFIATTDKKCHLIIKKRVFDL
jgi:transcriptional regulator of arginine metabolism